MERCFENLNYQLFFNRFFLCSNKKKTVDQTMVWYIVKQQRNLVRKKCYCPVGLSTATL